jgi:outer membrane lipoprotein SlyB
MTSYSGTVLRVADVKIQAETSGAVGAVAGAVMGGMVGSTIGSGGGKRVATTAGALGGAAAGSAAEQKLKTKAGVELEVELDDGRLMVIVQEKDDQYAVGDRIRVIQTPDGKLRVRQ